MTALQGRTIPQRKITAGNQVVMRKIMMRKIPTVKTPIVKIPTARIMVMTILTMRTMIPERITATMTPTARITAMKDTDACDEN